MRPAASFAIAAVLQASLVAAQQLPFDEAVARLKALDPSVRLSAIKLFVESGYPEAASPIADVLNDTDERVQQAAVYAELSLLLGVPVRPTHHVGLVVEVRNSEPAEALFDEGWSTLPMWPVPAAVLTGLLAPIAHKDLAFRLEALYTLGVLAQVDGVPPSPAHAQVAGILADRLADPAPAGREAVARVAGRIFRRCPQPCRLPGLDLLGDALVHTLNDPEPGVRIAAMGALGDFRWERAVQALAGLYDYYKKGDDASAALSALARIGHPSSVPVFLAALTRKEEPILVAAVEGLARAGSQEVAGLPTMLAGQSSAAVRLAVAFAEQRAGLAVRTDRLIAALDARATRQQAQDYLVELGTRAVVPVSAALRSALFDAVSPGLRITLIETLSVIGGPKDAAAVEPLLTDRNKSVAASAERAVTRLKARR
jgi:HEAT repeat protein